MQKFILAAALTLGLMGVSKANLDDGTIQRYDTPQAIYDSGVLACYSQAASAPNEDGSTRHWLHIIRNDKVRNVVLIHNIECNTKAISGEYRLGPSLKEAYVYFDDNEDSGDWDFDVDVQIRMESDVSPEARLWNSLDNGMLYCTECGGASAEKRQKRIWRRTFKQRQPQIWAKSWPRDLVRNPSMTWVPICTVDSSELTTAVSQ